MVDRVDNTFQYFKRVAETKVSVAYPPFVAMTSERVIVV